jgi:hypothetical protein
MPDPGLLKFRHEIPSGFASDRNIEFLPIKTARQGEDMLLPASDRGIINDEQNAPTFVHSASPPERSAA